MSWSVNAVEPDSSVGAVGQLGLEDRQAVAQGVAEALLLLRQHADDEVALPGDVGIGVAHHVDGDLGQRRHDELLGAEQVGVADARRMMRRSTKPRASLLGNTPSPTSIADERACSASTRTAKLSRSS